MGIIQVASIKDHGVSEEIFHFLPVWLTKFTPFGKDEETFGAFQGFVWDF
jgi:hypothetical protein